MNAVLRKGCLSDNLKPSFLPPLNWRIFSRRVTACCWRQWAKNQVSTNQNSRNGWRHIVSCTMRLSCVLQKYFPSSGLMIWKTFNLLNQLCQFCIQSITSESYPLYKGIIEDAKRTQTEALSFTWFILVEIYNLPKISNCVYMKFDFRNGDTLTIR